MSRIADYLIGAEEETVKIGKRIMNNAEKLGDDPEGFELELNLAISELQKILENVANPNARFECIYCGKKFAKSEGKIFFSSFHQRAVFTCLPCE